MLQVFSPTNVIFAGVGVFLLVCILPNAYACRFNTNISQAFKNIRTRQEALVDTFERLETFFRLLERYTRTEAPSNEGMVDTIMVIMIDVLSILAIATEEIKQTRTSKYLLYNRMS